MQNESFFSATRNGASVPGLSLVPLRLSYMSPKVASEAGGASPYDSYFLHSMAGVPDIRRGDLLTDTVNLDPVTNTNAVYRVFGNPWLYDQSYGKWSVEKVVGH